MPNSFTSISSSPGLELDHILQGHTDVITRIAWSPDGHTLASTSKDGTLRLWNPQTGELRQTVEAHAGSIYSMAWSPDGKILAIASHHGPIQFWDAETGRLSQVCEETPGSVKEQTKGNIYNGVIVKIEPSLQAVFVDYGGRRHGFLPMGEIQPRWYATEFRGEDRERRPRIQEVMKHNQKVLVQVVKEESGTRGASLSTYVALPGRYLVLIPGYTAGGISRKIEDEEERQKLKEIMAQLEPPPDMGVIVRTTGLNRNKEELQYDLTYLQRLWASIEETSRESPAPALVYQEHDLSMRSTSHSFTPQNTGASPIYGIAWLPDGRTLALIGTSNDIHFLHLWQEAQVHIDSISLGHRVVNKFEPTKNTTNNMRVYADPLLLQNLFGPLSNSGYSFIRLISEIRSSIEWSHRASLALASFTNIYLYNTRTLQKRQSLTTNSIVIGVAWSPDGRTLGSANLDGTVQLWNPETGAQIRSLEGHTDPVVFVAFSPTGQLLASKALDDTVRLWRCDTWETVAVFHEQLSGQWFSSLAFHPHAPVLATLGEKDTVIRLWKLDIEALLNGAQARPSVHYANAKVVLVGDSGVGKSGLGLVLSGQEFQPTDSTHGRRVWTFDRHTVVADGGQVETHETLLWDLAGQPGYRLIHQLHLHEIAVALVVFDSRSEIDPFAGVRHWDRALRLAQRLQGSPTLSLKKFLVAARADRGGIGVSPARIETLVRDLGFDGYFETSAREGWQIAELITTLRQAINWSALPRVSSTKFFQHIKDFLVTEKEAGRLLSTATDLYRAFLQSEKTPSATAEWRAQFETCIGHIESRGLIRRLSFGDLILLQPELLDAYASALVNAAKDEPEGLGCIAEEDARIGRFRMPADERIKDKKQEILLLIATIEEMLRHEIVLREQADDGPYLIFPSQFTREWSEAPEPEGKAVIFEFEGPVLNIYAMLAVRLSRSGFFTRKTMWKNAAEYSARLGGTCGILLREVNEGSGELTLFYDQATSDETRFQFEEYIRVHLNRRTLSESIRQRRIIVCTQCGFVVTEQLSRLLTDQGRHQLDCPVCKTRISLAVQEPHPTAGRVAKVQQMDNAADVKRERDTAVSILQGKIATNDFDVFLCHHSVDKRSVRAIGKKLKDRGFSPWLDEWELRPGFSWQKALEEQITKGKSVAVFVGKHGTGPWQDQEIEAFLRQGVRRSCPIIPVILSNCIETPEMPIFLGNLHLVDFRKRRPDPLQQLIWGITGERG